MSAPLAVQAVHGRFLPGGRRVLILLAIKIIAMRRSMHQEILQLRHKYHGSGVLDTQHLVPRNWLTWSSSPKLVDVV